MVSVTREKRHSRIDDRRRNGPLEPDPKKKMRLPIRDRRNASV
jgi:hypothetical protein